MSTERFDIRHAPALVANRKNLYIGTRKNHSPLGRSLFAPAVF